MKVLFFKGGSIWVKGTNPRFETADTGLEIVEDGTAAAESETAPEPGATLVPLRNLFDIVDEGTFLLAGQAEQILNWRRTFRFCSFCGAGLVRHTTEHAMYCPRCGQFFYPRLNPVVITLIKKGDAILLVHKAHNLYPFWSLVAGFVEPNETLEAAVAREVHEEVGIRLKNVRYAASQPWPFPNNLMIGFTAEWADGELKPDGFELDQAAWFTKENLPILPGPVSIARRLIDRWLRLTSEKRNV
jgi:NAD+ diphosphatase